MSGIMFARLMKVDEAKRLVYGRAVQEIVDKSNEVFDYETSKPYFEAWSQSVQKDSGGKSLGNLRSMHSAIAAGKVVDLQFVDTDKAIDIAAKVVDDAEWRKVLDGVYTGFSIGGRYVKKWNDTEQPDIKRYTADPTEISLVDRPAIPTATYFDVIKADGSTMQKMFKTESDGNGPSVASSAASSGDDVQGAGADADGTGGSVGADAVGVSKSAPAGPASEGSELEVNGSYEQLVEFAKVLRTHGYDVAVATKAVVVYAERAKKLDDIKAACEGFTAKGMLCVHALADCVERLYQLRDVLAHEAVIEDDNSPAPKELEQVAASLALVVARVMDEELRELQEGTGDKNKAFFDVMYGPMPSGNETVAVYRALEAPLASLLKKGDTERHNGMMQKMHDMLCEMGAKCSKLHKALGGAPAIDPEALEKITASITEKFSKELTDACTKIETLQEQVKKLSDMPAQPRAVLRVVSKSQDLEPADGNPDVPAPVMNGGKVNEVATAIKKIHQEGGKPYAFFGGGE